jgi:hypothetical protein
LKTPFFDETNRLLKETEQRTAELAVINSVQEGLAKEMDMQGIYDLIGDRIQQLFNAQAVIIATLDLDQQKEYFNYVFENNERIRLDSRPINALRQRLIDEKQFIYIASEAQAEMNTGVTAIASTKCPNPCCLCRSSRATSSATSAFRTWTPSMRSPCRYPFIRCCPTA